MGKYQQNKMEKYPKLFHSSISDPGVATAIIFNINLTSTYSQKKDF
jgi:hypothetical protein